jgi:hypothetical protein
LTAPESASDPVTINNNLFVGAPDMVRLMEELSLALSRERARGRLQVLAQRRGRYRLNTPTHPKCRHFV